MLLKPYSQQKCPVFRECSENKEISFCGVLLERSGRIFDFSFGYLHDLDEFEQKFLSVLSFLLLDDYGAHPVGHSRSQKIQVNH